jgi:hypothetical protein
MYDYQKHKVVVNHLTKVEFIQYCSFNVYVTYVRLVWDR